MHKFLAGDEGVVFTGSFGKQLFDPNFAQEKTLQ